MTLKRPDLSLLLPHAKHAKVEIWKQMWSKKKNICKCDPSKIDKRNRKVAGPNIQGSSYRSPACVCFFSCCSPASATSLGGAKERGPALQLMGRRSPEPQLFYSLPAVPRPAPPYPPLDHEWGLAHLFQTWKVWQEVGDSCILCPKQHPTSTECPSFLRILLFLT